MSEKEQLEVVVHALAVVVAIGSAAIGLYTYWRSTRTKAAEFLLELHKSFLLTIPTRRSATSWTTEPAAFTDFLNFFELVSYMGKEKMISGRDVEALLGYYLKVLTMRPELRGYIHNEKKGFEISTDS